MHAIRRRCTQYMKKFDLPVETRRELRVQYSNEYFTTIIIHFFSIHSLF